MGDHEGMATNRKRERWRSGPSKAVGILAVLLIATFTIGYVIRRRHTSDPPPTPLLVETMTVTERMVPEIIETSGSILSPQTVDVKPQTDGVLQSVWIHDGEQVHEGQLLFTIDPRPLQAVLAQAEATLDRDQALSADAADTEARYRALSKTGAVDSKSYITALRTLQSLRGTVASDRAQVEQTRLSLAYTQVRATISGRAGAIEVKSGNVVSSGSSTSLVTLNVASPIEASFALPHAQVDAVRAAHAGDGGIGLVVIALDSVSGQSLERGQLYFMDNAFDDSSGTLAIRARFANAHGLLWPGQFVTIRVILAEDPHTLAVPEGSLQQGQQGPYVYCLVNGHAVLREVSVARLVDGQAVVTKGLRIGDIVILTVPNELRDGSAVQSINPHGMPGPATSAPQA